VTRSTSARQGISARAKLLRLAESRSMPAPTGLCPKAQGCRNAATLGNRSTDRPTATRLRLIRSPHAVSLGHNAVGVVSISERAPKVGVARQPWAGGRNPVGIGRSAGLWRYQPVPSGHWPDGTRCRCQLAKPHHLVHSAWQVAVQNGQVARSPLPLDRVNSGFWVKSF